jgi:predicted ester cyclase
MGSHMDRRNFATQVARGGVAVATMIGGSTAEAASPGDSTATAQGLVQRFAATLSTHDIDAFAALFAEDFQERKTVAAAPPPSGTAVSSKQEVVRFFGWLLKAFPDLAVTARPVVASKGWLAANFIYSGTHQGAFLGTAPTGKHVIFNSTDILRIGHGLFVEHWGTLDMYGLFQQLKG